MVDKTKNLTIDSKKLMRLTVAQRIQASSNPNVRSYLETLTPVEYARLFPKYYRDKLPDIGLTAPTTGGAIPSGGGSTGAIYPPTYSPAPSGGGGGGTTPSGGGGTTPSGGGSTAGPAAATPAWLNNWMKSEGVEPKAQTIPKPPGSSGNPLSISRTKSFNQLTHEQKLKLYAVMEAEMGSHDTSRTRFVGETIYNRKDARNHSWSTILAGGVGSYFAPMRPGNRRHHVYLSALKRLQSDPKYFALMDQINTEIINGSNDAKLGTHNASARVGLIGTKIVATKDEERSYIKTDPKKHGAPAVKQETSWHSRMARELVEWEKLQSVKGPVPGTEVQTGDASQTGAIFPGQKDKEGVPIDEATLAEINKKRPSHMSGKIRIGEQSFTAGSGGRGEGVEAVPYGVFEAGPLVSPGDKLRGTFNRMRGKGRTKVVNIPNMFDPKLKRMRTQIQIHPAISPRDIDGDDVKDLISLGCIAVEPSQYDSFMEAYKNYYEENNGKVWFVNVPIGGGEHEWVITNKKPEGNIYTPREAIQTQKRTGEPIAEIAYPQGLNPGVVEYLKKLPNEQQAKFIEKLNQSPDSITKINQYYEEDVSFRTQNEQNEFSASVAETIISSPAPLAAKEIDIIPDDVRNLRVKDTDGKTKTLAEMGITHFSQLSEGKGIGGQAFKGGRFGHFNDPNVTFMAGKIQEILGDKFDRLTAQNDAFHHGSYARKYKSEHLKGTKLDFTIRGNKREYQRQIKILVKEFEERYGLIEGQHYKIHRNIDHGTGRHVDIGFTPEGRSVVLKNRQLELAARTSPAAPAQTQSSAYSAHIIANEPFYAGKELSDSQYAAIDAGLSMNNAYSDDVMEAYNNAKKKREGGAAAQPTAEPTAQPTAEVVRERTEKLTVQGVLGDLGGANYPNFTYEELEAIDATPGAAQSIRNGIKNDPRAKSIFATPNAMADVIRNKKEFKSMKDAHEKKIKEEQEKAKAQAATPKTEQAPSAAPSAAPTETPPPEQKTEEAPKAMSTGGTYNIPPGEDIAGVNIKTGQTEFYANSREGVSTELKFDPATISREQTENRVAQSDDVTNQMSIGTPSKPISDSSSVNYNSIMKSVAEYRDIGTNTPSAQRAYERTKFVEGRTMGTAMNRYGPLTA